MIFVMKRSATPPVIPVHGWDLTEANTGLAGVGLTEGDLTTYVGSPALSANTTYTEQLFTEDLDLSAGGVTLVRCSIHPTFLHSGWPCVYLSFVGSEVATLTDCDIDVSDLVMADGWDNVGFQGGGILTRCKIHGMCTGVKFQSGDTVSPSMNLCYIYGLRTQTGHIDGFTTRLYNGPGISITNSRICADYATLVTAAIIIQCTFGNIHNVIMTGNLLEGNGYNFILDNGGSAYTYHDIVLTNNRFTANVAGHEGYVLAGFGPGITQSENYVNDSGAADHKGTAVTISGP